MSEAIRRPELVRRFYEAVSVEPSEGGFAVALDGRRMKTPGRRPFAVPYGAAADAAAAEWAAQGDFVDPGTMPMTRLLNTVIDGVADDPAAVRADAARYAETDLLVYRAGEPERLAERQRLRWGPIVDWAEERLGGRFHLVEGVMHVAQPEATLDAYARRLARETDPFRIAALHQVTTLTGSALLAFALLEGRISAEEAWALAHLDEDWNIEQWGEDEEAAARRAARWSEMQAASLLLGAG